MSSETLLSKFVSEAPREISGSRTGNRFEYQVSWAFCLLLTLHKTQPDYLLVLDRHEDVVVFDSERDTASSMECFQIKTKGKGAWTLTDLTRVKKAGTLSILGKLYFNRLMFKDAVKKLHFISDAPFRFRTIGSPEKAIETDQCQLGHFCWKALTSLSAALQEQHNLEYCPLIDVETAFVKDSLPRLEHRTHAKGRFVEFMESLGCERFPVSAGFAAVCDELLRRNNCEEEITSVDSLRGKKGMGRSEFEGLIDKIRSAAQDERWRIIEAQLNSDGMDLVTVQNMRREWHTHEIQRLDTTNHQLHAARTAVAEAVSLTRNNIPLRPLPAFLDACLPHCRLLLPQGIAPFKDHNLKAIILSILSE